MTVIVRCDLEAAVWAHGAGVRGEGGAACASLAVRRVEWGTCVLFLTGEAKKLECRAQERERSHGQGAARFIAVQTVLLFGLHGNIGQGSAYVVVGFYRSLSN